MKIDQSVQKFVEHPRDYLLKVQHNAVVAEKKGFVTWIKAHLPTWCFGNYSLKNVVAVLQGQATSDLAKAVNTLVVEYNKQHPNDTKTVRESLKSPQAPTNIVDAVAIYAQKNHKFVGYGVQGGPVSLNTVPAITQGKMVLQKGVQSDGIGNVGNCYIWKEKPSIAADVPATIEQPRVCLPSGVSFQQFSDMRKAVQQAVSTKQGISKDEQQKIALSLAGITIEATLPYRAKSLNIQSEDVKVHCIFQTGLNLNGYAGGGVPVADFSNIVPKIQDYSRKNAEASVQAAVNNKSDVLVFNLGIGAGFFAGEYGSQVKEANVQGIIAASRQAKDLKIIVPDIGLSPSQRQALTDRGIKIIAADKDAVSALLAGRGVKVSQTIAADPMSILGIHGPGLWWETAGSASDEERAAFLTPCYALGHIPIEVYAADSGQVQKIAAMSEFMVSSVLI